MDAATRCSCARAADSAFCTLAAGLRHTPARRSSVCLFLIFQYAKLWAAGRSMGGADGRCAAPVPAGASAEQKNNQAGLESRRVH